MNPIVPWTARLAMGCLGLGWLLLAGRRTATPSRWFCTMWTAGAAIQFIHVAAAFHLVHHWSHTDAVRETARQTAATTGIHWGGGVWFNYVFTLAWLVDAVAVCGERLTGRTLVRPGLRLGLHAFLAFMAFNATAVFGPPAWRWIVPAYGLLLLLVWRRGRGSICRGDISPEIRHVA